MRFDLDFGRETSAGKNIDRQLTQAQIHMLHIHRWSLFALNVTVERMLCVLYLLLSGFSQMPVCYGYDQLDSFTSSLLREVMSKIGSPDSEMGSFVGDYGLVPQNSMAHSDSLSSNTSPKDYDNARGFEARRDAILGREPTIRDQEYLQHSSLFGHQYVQGGAGEGYQRLKPDGSMQNVQVVKTDGVLPAYCNPPDPCPLGYTAEDGCLEEFVNTAAFSRDYQASQECMCDSEHMFDCPGSTQESEIDAMARSFENEGLVDATLDRLIQDMQIEGEHKNLVAKKFFSPKPKNPFLQGEMLPVVAKKAPKVLAE